MTLFRYQDVQFASMNFDIDGEWSGGAGRLEAVLMQYGVWKETAKGYWINDDRTSYLDGTLRWVSKTSKKRFAHAEKDEAWKSFKARKQRQIQIYSARLERAKKAFELEQPK